MFITDADHLARELVASQGVLRNHLDSYEPMVRAYHGRAWDGALDRSPAYESHTYEYISAMLPRLVHQAPQFTIDTSRGGRQQVLASALERGLNHWAASSRLHEPLEDIAQDALFGWGGAFIEEIPNDQMTLNKEQRAQFKGSPRRAKSVAGEYPEDMEKPYWPRVRRLEPHRWGWDTASPTDDGIRFYYHKVTEDKDELIDKALAAPDDWIVEKCEDMQTTTDREELGYSKSSSSTPDRKQVTYYVVWVPDGKIDGEEPGEDEHGVIYTLSSTVSSQGSREGTYIRRPYYFYGPPQGPYVKIGFYKVPRTTVPLSPLVAVHDQAEISGRVNRAVVQRIERYKRGIMFDLKDKKDLERLRDSKDDDFIGVSGLTRDGVVPVETGGATQQDLGHHSWLREQLQTASGMDDAQRGNVTGQGTATEVAVASESSQHRTGYLVQKWREFVADAVQRVAWYAAHDDRVIFTYRVEEDEREGVAMEAVEAGMMPMEDAESFMRYGAAIFQGGDFKGDDDLAFEDLDLRIEPYSMQRRDQRTRKIDLVEALNLLTQFVGAAAQGVPVEVGKIADLLADVYSMPEIADVVNRDMAAQLGILSMEERVASMQADASSSQGGPDSGGRNAQGRRSEGGPGGGKASGARSQSSQQGLPNTQAGVM